MSSSTFCFFPQLPTELRNKIWHHSMPTITTIHISEGADLDVTSISAPPGQQFANKEAHKAYVSSGLKGYAIYTIEDWADMYVNEDTTIQLIITPPQNPTTNLYITWTALEEILHAALPVVKKLHIVCSQPERLVRLWMLPEGGLIHVGQTHWNKPFFFGEQGVLSDQKYRESLRTELKVTTSSATLDELAQGSQAGVQMWEMVEEQVIEGFGPEAEIKRTKGFKLVGGEEEREMEEGFLRGVGLMTKGFEMSGGHEDARIKEWEDMMSGAGEKNEGELLTEKAMERFLHETEWKPKKSTPSSIYSVDVVYDGELWLTVA
jgi:hypothetical protein